MNFPGEAASRPWCYPYYDAGEAAAASGDTTGSFTAMIADYSTDDLFDLPWEQGGGGPGPGSTTTAQPAAEPCCWSSRFKPPPEMRCDPPSEGEMAAWLRAIVKGEELAFTDDGGREQTADGQDVPETKGSTDASTTTDKKEKLPMTEEATTMGTKLEMRKPPAGGGSTSRRPHPHHGEAHNLTEKRRRHKINERLRTLQQLVPGCDNKSNQASTLDQTIQYMKSLQQHVQAMSFGAARPAAAAAAVYHVVQPQHAPPVDVPMMPAAPVVLAPAPAMVVPFGAMLQLPHYPAAGVPVMMPAATAAPLYPAARAAAAPEGARSSASHRRGSSSRSSKGKGGGSLRQKH